MRMNDDKQKQLNEELFDFLVKQAAREVAEEETQESFEMCENSPRFVTSPDYEERIAKILSSATPKGKKSFRFKAVISVAVVTVVLFVLLATPVAADFRAYINQLVFGNAPTHNNVVSLKYYDEYRAALIESGLDRIYVPTHSRLRGLEPDISVEVVENHTKIKMHYSANGSWFDVNQVFPAPSIESYDIERSDVNQVIISGENAYLWEYNNDCSVIFNHDGYFFDIVTNTSLEIAIEIAESLNAITIEEASL